MLLAPSTASADRLRTIDVATGASTVLASSPNLEWLDPPCWAGDGRLVALEYKSTRRALLRRYVAYDPTGARHVLARASRFTSDALLAPGCARVAERRRRMPLGGAGVMIRDLAGAPVAELSAVASGSGAEVAWSPDGSLLAYADEDVVRVVEPATGRVVAESAGDSVPDAGFSPDGRSILLVDYVRGARVTRAVILDLAAGASRELVTLDALFASAWSPRGDRIALALEDGIHLLDPEGREPAVTAAGSRTTNISWSPDGASLAFSRRGRRSVSHYVVAAESLARRRLLLETRGVAATPLAWSPDGTRIAVGGG